MIKDSFKVSVIIPVYNAEKYIVDAVNSAMNLDEVGEIILVEDNSPDKSLIICKKLENEHKKIRLFQHKNGENRGAGISRNLGIEKSSFNYISFLDADDVYLSTRFKIDAKILLEKDVDGVYNSTGKFEDKNNLGPSSIFRDTPFSPKDVLYNMLAGKINFDTNGITLKKEILLKVGGFGSLELHEDTLLWYKIAHFGIITKGNLKEAVALTRNHDERRIYKRSDKSKIQFLDAVLNNFSSYENVDKRFLRAVINRYCWTKSRFKIEIPLILISLSIKYPSLLKHYL